MVCVSGEFWQSRSHLCKHDFSDFTESYEILASTFIQICLLMHIKFCGFGSPDKIAKICASLKLNDLR